MLVRPAPVVYFPGPAGKIEGLDVDLLRLYAAEKKLVVRFIPVDDVAKLLAALDDGDGHIGAGGLLRPLSPARSDASPAPAASAGLPPDRTRIDDAPSSWTQGYYTIEPVLIYNTDGFKPANWSDLDGEMIAFSDIPGLEPEIESARKH